MTDISVSTPDPSLPGSTAPAPPAPGPPSLGPRELLRWTWRQLTSMRTALILLFLLALGAVPGSVIPQTSVDSVAASQWQQHHPKLAPIYEKLGLFHVYGSVWFAAIYVLLMISLVGCIVPRTRVYWRGLRAQPPATPRNLARLAEHRQAEVDATPEEVLARARAALRGYRLRRGDAADSISAERGYLREAGNLLFHLSVLVVLVGVAMGSLFGYKGGVIVVTGDGFSNSPSQYDDLATGGFFRTSSLAPFSFKVDSFDVTFIKAGRAAGMAHEFHAALTYKTSPDAKAKTKTISVNHPLHIDGTDIFLLSHGYAPHITVRDGKGNIAYSGSVVFIPEDTTFRSFGAVPVPDAVNKDGKPEQLGFEGEFYPTYAFTMKTGPFSAFPDDKNPAISMLAYTGVLNASDKPQSVYTLDKTGLKPIKVDGKQLRVDLGAGQSKTLPDGMGTITFDGVSRYVKLQISRSPGQSLALLGVSLALLGLLGSLFIRPRRLWVRVRPVEGADGSGRTLVEIAGLERSSGGDLAARVDALAEAVTGVPAGHGDESGDEDGAPESAKETT